MFHTFDVQWPVARYCNQLNVLIDVVSISLRPAKWIKYHYEACTIRQQQQHDNFSIYLLITSLVLYFALPHVFVDFAHRTRMRPVILYVEITVLLLLGLLLFVRLYPFNVRQVVNVLQIHSVTYYHLKVLSHKKLVSV